jgi:hypothetical protein
MGQWIVEADDGRVLRVSEVGMILSGSDPEKYGNRDLANKVAEGFMGLMVVHGIKLNLKAIER